MFNNSIIMISEETDEIITPNGQNVELLSSNLPHKYILSANNELHFKLSGGSEGELRSFLEIDKQFKDDLVNKM